MTPNQIRVLIADDHTVVSEALSLCLDREPDMRVVGTARTGRETLRLTLDMTPDVLLLDLRLPDLDGLQVLSAIQAANDRPVVLCLTAFPSEDHLRRALALGASGFLSKDIGLHLIPAVVRTALSGKAVVVSGSLSDSMLRPAEDLSIRQSEPVRMDGIDLSEEEVQMLDMLAEGLDNSEIGQRLSLSGRTVKARLARVYKRIGVRHRTEAVIWAVDRGIVAES